MLTSYVTPTLRALDSRKAERPIEIGFRRFIQPLEFGRLAFEKHKIGDDVHCSGVLMCTKDPDGVLREFHRILRPGGFARLMVYNYDSIWLHLYVAFILRRSNPSLAGLPILEAFKKSTDGEQCPINTCWTAAAFAELAQAAGFQCRHLGNAISLIEMSFLHERFAAAQSRALEPEHRKFILSLTFDARLVPHYNGQVAGIDGCYELRKSS